MYFKIVTLDMILKMEIAENEENNTTNPVNPPPPLPTTVELCTLPTKYVFEYTFKLEQVLKKRFVYNP